MMCDVPAKGYVLISGKSNPRSTEGGYWVQLATDEPELGWLDLHGPWPASGGGVVWKWAKPDKGPKPWEVVAVKRA